MEVVYEEGESIISMTFTNVNDKEYKVDIFRDTNGEIKKVDINQMKPPGNKVSISKDCLKILGWLRTHCELRDAI